MTQRDSVESGYCSEDEEDTNPTTATGSDPATAETPLLGLHGQKAGDLPESYRLKVQLLLYTFLFAVLFASNLLVPPMNAIMENIICRNSFPDVSHNLMDGDPRCKGPKVQGTLAMILGWSATFECIPSVLAALPFGIMSDKLGRRPVLFISTLGVTLSLIWIVFVLYFPDVFAIQWYWFNSFFLLIGGGPPVLIAMLYTIAADVTPVEERATVFFRCGSLQLVAEIIGGPLAGFMMRQSEWLPILVAFALIAPSLVLSYAFPETLGLNTHDKAKPVAAAAANNDQNVNTSNEESPVTKVTKLSTKVRAILDKGVDELFEVQKFVLGNLRVTFLLLSIVFIVLGKFVQVMLLQYATARYGWSWDEAAILLSIRSISHLILLLAILPAISWVLLNTLRMPGVAKDLWIARVSGIIQVTGALMVAFSVDGYMLMVSLVVFAAGGGMIFVIRSLANALVEEHHIGIVNSLIGFMEMAGMLIAGPVLSASLRKGFELGGLWQGLPFFAASVLFTVATVIVWAFRIPQRHLDTATSA